MVRYALVSVVALLADLGVLFSLYYIFHINYLVAASVGFAVGLIVNYKMSHNRIFVNPKIESRMMNFGAFAAIGLIGLVANDVVIWLGHSVLGYTVVVAKIIAVALVFFWNFLARRQMLYMRKEIQEGVE